MVLAHQGVLAVLAVAQRALTLAVALALERLDKGLLAVLQPPLERLAVAVVAAQVR